MMILSVNAGSSSLKFKLFKDDFSTVAEGRWERDAKKLIFKHDSITKEENANFKDHCEVFKYFIMVLEQNSFDVADIKIVAHRAVHGGRKFIITTYITSEVLEEFSKLTGLAPLHNPANISCVMIAQRLLPDAYHYFIFDTAYHFNIPMVNRIYSLPFKLYEQGIQKYGFHGISHQDMMFRTASILKKDTGNLNMLSCHLGNGSSICCIKGGLCYDTSMGMTPLDGLTMGTRCGSLDPGIYPMLVKIYGSVEKVDTILNKESGLLGITGVSDMRTLLKLKEEEDYYATLAVAKFVQDIRKTIGAYLMELEYNVDAIVFTGGIGENCKKIVREVTQNLEKIGIILSKKPEELTVSDSPVKVLQLRADEELAMAEEAWCKYLFDLDLD